ncbi:MAG: efflux RND transporter periplasmic adaptor subunit [Myxococcales bacterium]|nr:efflux RND transporter periplasmic adaptor subunit [Myxococcales bacterium]
MKAALFIFFVLWVGNIGPACGLTEQPDEPDTHNENAASPVYVQAAVLGSAMDTLRSSATVSPRKQVVVTARLDGTVVDVPVDVGMNVTEGQTLAMLHNPNPDLAINRARTQIRRIEDELRKIDELINQGLVPRQNKTDLQFELKQARISQEEATTARTTLHIAAPLAGTILGRQVEPGMWVAPGTPMFVIATAEDLLVPVALSERALSRLKIGQTAKIRAIALPDREFPATLERIHPAVDATTGTILATFAVVDITAGKTDGLKLLPGMFADVEIEVEQLTNVVLIPRQAVLYDQNTAVVFVAENGTAKRNSIVVGPTNGEHIAVLRGVDDGDLVVTVGQNSLQDGARIEIKEKPVDSAGESSPTTPPPAPDKATGT